MTRPTLIARAAIVLVLAFAAASPFAARALIDQETRYCTGSEWVIGRSITGNHAYAYSAWAGTTTSDPCDTKMLAGAWECQNTTTGSMTETWTSGAGLVHYSLCGVPYTIISSYLHQACNYSPLDCSNEFDTYSQE
jgi:hypothetical protein